MSKNFVVTIDLVADDNWFETSVTEEVYSLFSKYATTLNATHVEVTEDMA